MEIETSTTSSQVRKIDISSYIALLGDACTVRDRSDMENSLQTICEVGLVQVIGMPEANRPVGSEYKVIYVYRIV